MNPALKKITASFLLFLVGFLVIAPRFSPVSAQAGAGISCIVRQLTKFLTVPGTNITFDPTQWAMPDGPWYEPNTCQFREKVKDDTNPEEIFGERYTFAQVNWIIHSLLLIFDPTQGFADVVDFFKQMTDGFMSFNQLGPQDYAKLGVPGLLTYGIAEIYQHPAASGVDSINSTLAKFDLVPSAYAQGYGYTALNPIMSLWIASRNMAYLLLVIILIAAGFLIMFRVKINPQTVVSLQMMIPKLIITLVLITFSYAIAGLVIDLIYVVISVIVALAASQGLITNVGGAISFFTQSSFKAYVGYYITPALLLAIIGSVAFVIAGAVPVLGPVLVGLGALGAIIGIVALIALIFTVFKVYWMLLKTYITLLLLIVIGPWQIMLGLLPGQQGFSSWFRNILANASVFVVVPLMFMIDMFFWVPFFNIQGLQQLFMGFASRGMVSSFSALPQLPLVGTYGIVFNLAIGYVILALTPKVADMVKEALKAPAFKYGAALGEPMGAVRGFYSGFTNIQRQAEQDRIRRSQVKDLGGPRFGSAGVGEVVSSQYRRAEAKTNEYAQKQSRTAGTDSTNELRNKQDIG
jgi:hypothetical protein